ncbi:MAG: hypothetical protein LBG29_08345 [Synergistaceae bacterium]|nr:hypothetical protein [Synergistaceae bacterium]
MSKNERTNNTFLFDDAGDVAKSADPGFRLDVVRADFIQAESMSWVELFSGFDHLYAIAYSSGIDKTNLRQVDCRNNLSRHLTCRQRRSG